MGTELPHDAMLKDLDIQWRDHFHMRDQTWKTLTYSALFFLGIVGLDLKGHPDSVMIPAYAVVLVVALFGFVVAAHHRTRQGQKFEIIEIYEKELGIYALKQGVLSRKETFVAKVFTAGFIKMVQLSIAVVALVLLINRLLA